jgi:methionine-rich copper-binding protein CopC
VPWPPRFRWYAIAACAVVLAGWWAVGTGRPPDFARSPAARSVVTGTQPANGAALAGPPTGVELSFSAAVDPDRSHVSVRDGSGAAVGTGEPRLVTPDRLRQPVAIASAGEVTVDYHVLLVSGERVAGTLRFSVETATATGSEAVVAAAPAAGAHRHQVDPLSAGLLILDGVVVLVVLALLARRPRRSG